MQSRTTGSSHMLGLDGVSGMDKEAAFEHKTDVNDGHDEGNDDEEDDNSVTVRMG